MGLILKSLPRYTGPYLVSTHDLELGSTDSPSSRSFSPALLKSTKCRALQLDTTLFTLFYPTSSSTKRSTPMTWLERPLSVTAKGYAKFLGKSPWLVKGIVYLFGRNLYLATNGIDQPLKGGERTDEKEHEEKFPVVIFSHGLSGNRTTYSQYCGELASRGFVVVAIEHRDGSGPVSIVKLDDDDASRGKIVDYIKESDIYYENEKDQVPFLEFRARQLEMRQAEILQILSHLKRINSGDSTHELELENRRRRQTSENKGSFDWQPWKGKLDFDNLFMTGHSFGGATTIQILRSNSKYGFKAGIGLDPWADPIPPAVIELELDTQGSTDSTTSTVVSTPTFKGEGDGQGEGEESSPAPAPASISNSTNTNGKSGGETGAINVPFLVINSEAFTLWKPHFYLVRNIVTSVKNNAPSWFFTILGSIHISFSDLPLFLPSYLSPKAATTPPFTSHSLIVETSIEFLKGQYKDGEYLGASVKIQGDQEYINPKRGEGEKGPLIREEGEGYVRLHVKRNI